MSQPTFEVKVNFLETAMRVYPRIIRMALGVIGQPDGKGLNKDKAIKLIGDTLDSMEVIRKRTEGMSKIILAPADTEKGDGEKEEK